MISEKAVEEAVDQVLSENEFPIYQTQDDNGLDPREYKQFVLAVLARLPAHSLQDGGWQPIDTAPLDGTVVLICGHDKDGAYYVADAKWDGGWLLFVPDNDDHTEPSWGHTHWQPLPAPPRPVIAEDHAGGE